LTDGLVEGVQGTVPAICDQLRHCAASTPTKPALVMLGAAGERVLSWRELERATAAIAEEISRAAASRRSHVILTEAGNDGAALLKLIATLRTATPMAMLPGSARRAHREQLRETLLRAGHDVLEFRDRHVTSAVAARASRSALPAESVLLATSGSAGRPRLVVDTFMRSVGRRPRGVRPSSAMNWRPGQRQLVMGALSHAAALTFFIEGLADGSTMVMSRSFEPRATLDILARWRVEWAQLTPYHLRYLAGAARRRPVDLSGIRGLLHMAAPCPARLKRFWIDAVGASSLFEIYGSTEGIGITLIRGDDWLKRPGTVGRGFFTQIQVRDESGAPLPPGETGEVHMRSGHPARAVYLNSRHHLPRSPDGFASVGDRGRLDEAGYLYLAPRQLGRIQVGGETVYAGEVEELLLDHPGVFDAGVAGVPDERLGEVLVAMVVPTGRPDALSIRRYLWDRVARHKVPRTVYFVDNLPYGPAGKLDRAGLAELAATCCGKSGAEACASSASAIHRGEHDNEP
jgi:bile acid-coenzyme A ligase